MKKYISIILLTATFLLESCDRSDADFISENPISNKGRLQETKLDKAIFEKFGNINETLNTAQIDQNKPETGDDDDEPRKDKSHWRIANDTVH